MSTTPGSVGQEALQDLLGRLWGEAVQSRSGALVVLQGAPGSGKTAAARAFSQHVAGAALVMWGGCRPDAPELWPWVQALQGDGRRSSELVRMHADLSSASAQVAATVGAAAARRPVLIVLDDLHDADASTLRCLRFLVGDLPRLPVLVLATTRTGTRQGELYGSVLDKATVLPIPPLSAGEVELLLQTLGADPALVARAAQVQVHTTGLPLLVQEVVRLTGLGWPVDRALESSVQQRLAALPAPCRPALTLAAVAGEPARLPVIAAALEQSCADVGQALTPAVLAGILVETDEDDQVRFRHEVYRERLLAGLHQPERHRLHLQVARAMQGLGEGGLAVARHHLAAGHLGDLLAAQHAMEEAAAEAAQRSAHGEAAGHLQDAATAARRRGDTATADRLTVSAAEAGLLAGELAAARRHAESLLARAGDCDVLARAALVLHAAGTNSYATHSTVTAALRRGLQVRGEHEDGLHVRLLSALARSLVHDEDAVADSAQELAAQAVRLARRLDDPALLAFCLRSSLTVLWQPGTAGQRLELAREMRTAAQLAGDSGLALDARLEEAAALLELGDPVVHARIADWERAANRTGQPHAAWLALTRRTCIALVSGQLQDAARLIAEEAERGRRLGEPEVQGIVALHHAELRRWQIGWSSAQAEAQQLATPGVSPMNSEHPLSEVIRAAASGDTASAAGLLRTRLEPTADDAPGWTGLFPQVLVLEFALVLGALDVCERRSRRLAPHADEWVLMGGGVACYGPVQLYLGLSAAALGHHGEAITALTAAAESARRLGAPLWQARAACELAVQLADRDQGHAQQLLDEAHAAAVGRHAEALLERVAAVRAALHPTAPVAPVLRRDGEGWQASFGGRSAWLPDMRGLHDLATLLRSPDTGVAADELVAPGGLPEAALGADEVLDEQARREYRNRLATLAAAVDEAQRAGDPVRAAAARSERDLLESALRSARGLGGRGRRLGDGGERARKAVTARIRAALDRLEPQHPAMAQHLRDHVRTGRMCCYTTTTTRDHESRRR